MTTTPTQFEEERLRDEWHDFVYKVLPNTKPADAEILIAEWWIPKTLSLLHQQREMIRKGVENKRKEIDTKRETDEKRYPIGYNQAITDTISLLSNKEIRLRNKNDII